MKGVCTRCKQNTNYNFEIDNGLCNVCIADDLGKLDALSTANAELKARVQELESKQCCAKNCPHKGFWEDGGSMEIYMTPEQEMKDE
jgi:hypothetical protein